jgi:hypothetical protein
MNARRHAGGLIDPDELVRASRLIDIAHPEESLLLSCGIRGQETGQDRQAPGGDVWPSRAKKRRWAEHVLEHLTEKTNRSKLHPHINFSV